MNSYCNLDNGYNNIINESKTVDLDKLARQINSDKKNRPKNVYQNLQKNIDICNTGILAFQDLEDNKKDKIYKKHHEEQINGFYSAQGDYMKCDYNNNELSGTIIQDIINDKKKKKSIPLDKYEDISIDTPSDNNSSSNDNSSASSSSFSSITFDTKDIDKEVKQKSKYNSKKKSRRYKCMDFDLDSVDSLESLDSGESLLRHIRFCIECKKKLIELIKKDKNERKKTKCTKKCDELERIVLSENKIENMENNFDKNKDSSKSNESYEIKEILTICLIGFLIIIFLDLVLRMK